MTKLKDEIEKIHKEIHKIILSSKELNSTKYKLVPYIARWAAELKYKEEYKDLLDSERINIAIHDVLTGKVSLEYIKSLGPIDSKKKLRFIEASSSEPETDTEQKKKKSDKKK